LALADYRQPCDRGASSTSGNRDGERAFRERLVLWLERAQRRARAACGDLGPQGPQGGGAGTALPRVARQLAAGGVLDDGGAADRRGQRAEHGVQPPALDDQALESLVNLRTPLQHRVVLVDERRERTLGDRDEGHLVWDLE